MADNQKTLSVEPSFSRDKGTQGNATTKECIDKAQENVYRSKASFRKRLRTDKTQQASLHQLGSLTLAYQANASEVGSIARKLTSERESMTCNTDLSKDHPCANLSTPGAYYSSCK